MLDLFSHWRWNDCKTTDVCVLRLQACLSLTMLILTILTEAADDDDGIVSDDVLQNSNKISSSSDAGISIII